MTVRRFIVGFVVMLGIACWMPATSGAESTGEATKVTTAEQSPEIVTLPDSLMGADPHDPEIRLNYASIRFYRARRLLLTDIPAAQLEFKGIEGQLIAALQLSEADEAHPGKQLLRSQSAFMLGDLYWYIFHDSARAKTMYQDALRYFPEHDGASEALKRIQ